MSSGRLGVYRVRDDLQFESLKNCFRYGTYDQHDPTPEPGRIDRVLAFPDRPHNILEQH